MKTAAGLALILLPLVGMALSVLYLGTGSIAVAIDILVIAFIALACVGGGFYLLK